MTSRAVQRAAKQYAADKNITYTRALMLINNARITFKWNGNEFIFEEHNDDNIQRESEAATEERN